MLQQESCTKRRCECLALALQCILLCMLPIHSISFGIADLAKLNASPQISKLRLVETRTGSLIRSMSKESQSSLETIMECPILGLLTPLKSTAGPQSVVQQREVPTFYAHGNIFGELSLNASIENPKIHVQDLNDKLGGHGPAFLATNVLSLTTCQGLIQTFDTLGFQYYDFGKTKHGALQVLVSDGIAQAVFAKLRPFLDLSQVERMRREMDGLNQKPTTSTTSSSKPSEIATQPMDSDPLLTLVGLHCRWRIYRYESGCGDNFGPHIDAGFPPSGVCNDGQTWQYDTTSNNSNASVVSRLTILMYLNDDFENGCTTFYSPMNLLTSENNNLSILHAVKPITGACLIFPQAVGEDAADYARSHWPLHEGSIVTAGTPKYVIRSDILFDSNDKR